MNVLFDVVRNIWFIYWCYVYIYTSEVSAFVCIYHCIYSWIWWVLFPPEVKDNCSSSAECGTTPLRQISQSSLSLHRKSFMLNTFCTEHNVQECLSHISQVCNLPVLRCVCSKCCSKSTDHTIALSWVRIWSSFLPLSLSLFPFQQEVTSLGLPPVWPESGGSSEMNVVAVLNCMYDLIQLHRRGLRTLENMEVEQLKSSSNLDYLQLTSTRLKVLFNTF